MQSGTVVEVCGLGKEYRIGVAARRPATFAKAVGQAVASPFAYLRTRLRKAREDEILWALRDVSFSVAHGEVVGIIGRNGAGKSTLLKILSRITDPTEGWARISGRVNSLLEVGTGFHPDLTGRENVYMNAAIHGMTRSQVDAQFGSIVEFADIVKFIDTPVKRYSSGMYVRLAFAVAAHLDSSVLLVDEVLSVGDADFQKRCMGRMEDVAGSGRTVLFVSHNMAAVQSLCSRCILLNKGRIQAAGPTDKVMAEYLGMVQSRARISLRERQDREGNGALRFTSVHAETDDRGVTDTLRSGEAVTMVLDYEAAGGRAPRNVSVSMPFTNHMGVHMVAFGSRLTGQDWSEVPPVGQFRLRIPRFPLMPGRYTVDAWSDVNSGLSDWVRDAAVFDVVEGDFFGTGHLPPLAQGGVLVEHAWRVDGEPPARKGLTSAVDP